MARAEVPSLGRGPLQWTDLWWGQGSRLQIPPCPAPVWLLSPLTGAESATWQVALSSHTGAALGQHLLPHLES